MMDVPAMVEMRMPADARHLPVVRAVAHTIAMREDFDLDAISDLTLAVDVLCSELIQRATSGSMVECRFDVKGNHVTVRGTAVAASRVPHNIASFGWRVLSTLVDSARTWLDDPELDPSDGVGQALLHIEVAKSRGAAASA